MNISGYKPNFETIKLAAQNKDLALMDVFDERLGRHQAALCAVSFDEYGRYVFSPLAVMCEGNPYDYLVPPTGVDDGS